VRSAPPAESKAPRTAAPRTAAPSAPLAPSAPSQSYADRKQASAERNKRERAYKALKGRVAELEARIADREKAIKDVEQTMSAPDFYNDHEKSKPVLARHQALMWEVGELLAQWEMLQSEADQYSDLRNS
jgi:ATP-binding cassette subfamily F protein 3